MKRPLLIDGFCSAGGASKGFGSWFSGFGGVDCGAKAAGLELVFACEYDPQIAAVYKLNFGNHITVADILMLDNGISHPNYPRSKNAEKRRRQDIFGDWWTRAVKRGANPKDFEFSTPQFPHVNFKHDSPPCPEFSNAKANGQEGLRDIALARKCCEYLMYARPDFYTLENVFGYRKSESWKTIANTLHGLGYTFNYWHVNMADYGVPQTRKRMIVIARRDGLRPQLPPATHAENPEVGLFGTLKPWVGWYEAIADLIPSLPESKFAKWQLSRLPEELRTMLLANGQYNNQLPAAFEDEPANAITANENQGSLRAFIAPIQGEATNGFYDNEPAQTIAANHGAGKYRALIVDGRNSNQEWGKLYREGEEPATAVTVLERPAHYPRAFVIDHQNISRDATVRGEGEPFFTAQALQMRRPSSTPSAYSSGRIVQMTTRALARFQSFPDSYQLSGDKKNDCRGIGNACPPLFVEQLLREVMQSNP